MNSHQGTGIAMAHTLAPNQRGCTRGRSRQMTPPRRGNETGTDTGSAPPNHADHRNLRASCAFMGPVQRYGGRRPHRTRPSTVTTRSEYMT